MINDAEHQSNNFYMDLLKRLRIAGIILMQFLLSCDGQSQQTSKDSAAKNIKVGGHCEEGYCELIYLGMPQEINSVDTSAGWYEKGTKLLIRGKVLQVDGKTPAPNVIVYYHHTDNEGYYSPRNDKPENQTRHGHIRGWVRTDEGGNYSLYTIKPGAYPNENLPAHIHLIIKEPDLNEYWIDDITFDGDSLLLSYLKSHPSVNPRGGSGTVKVTAKDNLQTAPHKIVLGLNIPDYPERK